MLDRLFGTGEYHPTTLQSILDFSAIAGFFMFLLLFESLVEYIF